MVGSGYGPVVTGIVRVVVGGGAVVSGGTVVVTGGCVMVWTDVTTGVVVCAVVACVACVDEAGTVVCVRVPRWWRGCVTAAAVGVAGEELVCVSANAKPSPASASSASNAPASASGVCRRGRRERG